MTSKLTREQITALKRVYDREWDKPNSYLQFRRSCSIMFGTGGISECVMVPFCNMWLGIERDGYTHS